MADAAKITITNMTTAKEKVRVKEREAAADMENVAAEKDMTMITVMNMDVAKITTTTMTTVKKEKAKARNMEKDMAEERVMITAMNTDAVKIILMVKATEQVLWKTMMEQVLEHRLEHATEIANRFCLSY